MAEPELFPAVWDGPFDAFLPDMSVLKRGDEHQVTAADLESGHWKPIEPKAKAKAAAAPPAEAEVKSS